MKTIVFLIVFLLGLFSCFKWVVKNESQSVISPPRAVEPDTKLSKEAVLSSSKADQSLSTHNSKIVNQKMMIAPSEGKQNIEKTPDAIYEKQRLNSYNTTPSVLANDLELISEELSTIESRYKRGLGEGAVAAVSFIDKLLTPDELRALELGYANKSSVGFDSLNYTTFIDPELVSNEQLVVENMYEDNINDISQKSLTDKLTSTIDFDLMPDQLHYIESNYNVITDTGLSDIPKDDSVILTQEVDTDIMPDTLKFHEFKYELNLHSKEHSD